MFNAIRTMLTASDNKSHVAIKWGIVGGSVAMIALQGYAICKGQSFSPESFGIGLGVLLGGGGAGVGLSAKAEPTKADSVEN